MPSKFDPQTDAMRKMGKPYSVVCKDGAGYYGMEFVNHPTPSGSERHLPTVSDNRRWADADTAATEFAKLLKEVTEETTNAE